MVRKILMKKLSLRYRISSSTERDGAGTNVNKDKELDKYLSL